MLARLARWEATITRCIRPQESRGLIQVLGRKLQTRLTQRVKEEQAQVKTFLGDLAERQAKEVQNGLGAIRADLGKAPTTLPSYIDYVQKLEDCGRQKEELCEKKKRLEDIKTVLSKYKNKDDAYQSMPLQGRIDALAQDIEKTEEILLKAHEETTEAKGGHCEELERRMVEE